MTKRIVDLNGWTNFKDANPPSHTQVWVAVYNKNLEIFKTFLHKVKDSYDVQYGSQQSAFWKVLLEKDLPIIEDMSFKEDLLHKYSELFFQGKGYGNYLYTYFKNHLYVLYRDEYPIPTIEVIENSSIVLTWENGLTLKIKHPSIPSVIYIDQPGTSLELTGSMSKSDMWKKIINAMQLTGLI